MIEKTTDKPLKIMIYDKTDMSRPVDINGDGITDLRIPGLSRSWEIGRKLYKATGAIDIAKGVGSWDEAVEFLLKIVRAKNKVAEVSFWGHASPGAAYINGEPLDIYTLNGSTFDSSRLKLRKDLANISFLMESSNYGTGPTYNENGLIPLWWFRGCSMAHGLTGISFMREFSDFMRADVVAHACVIGHYGLHSYGYGFRYLQKDAHWSPEDGYEKNKYGAMVPKTSWFTHPNTITCLTSKVPESWWEGGSRIGKSK
ncbi:MAG: hypothetical protein QNK24_10365 [Desulfuromusa sp.]|nr:hypothetical protein [Desulfuromusa sp.]